MWITEQKKYSNKRIAFFKRRKKNIHQIICIFRVVIKNPLGNFFLDSNKCAKNKCKFFGKKKLKIFFFILYNLIYRLKSLSC
jgi:hypothetical protein